MNRRRERRQERRAQRKQKREERKADRKEALQGTKGLNRLAKSIGIRQKNFRANSADIVRDRVQDIKESRPFDAIDSIIESRFMRLRARYWRTRPDGSLAVYPEMNLPEVRNRPNIGICFSGGGTRSALASFGTMRALHELGHAERFRYTSAVSGGTWFTIPYTFMPRSISDGQFFGSSLRLDQLQGSDKDVRDQVLNSHFSSRFSTTAATSEIWTSVVVGGVADEVVDIFKPGRGTADEAWSRAVGHHLLNDFGLFDAQRINSSHSFFTWSEQTKREAREASKFLDDLDFITTQHPRPYSIAGGVVFGTEMKATVLVNGSNTSPVLVNAGQLEMTPLYSGIPTHHSGLGGGYIESYAIDQAFDKFAGETQFLSQANSPKHRRFTLSDMIGIASSAMGVVELAGYNHVGPANFLSPNIEHWSFGAPHVTRKLTAIDGGYLENLGIMPLLRRQVERIIVCDNPGFGFPEKGRLTGSISHLFGVKEGFWDTTYSELLGRFKNQVFSNNAGEYRALHDGLTANHAASGVAWFRQTLQVQENRNYAIRPYQVEILWLVLTPSPTTSAVAAQVNALETRKKEKKNIPKVPSIGTARLNISGEEASLIANHTGTAVHRIADELADFLA